MFLIMPSQFGQGFQVPQLTVNAINRTATKVQGQLVAFDFANSDAGVTDTNMDGGTDSAFGNVVATRSNAVEEAHGIFGVVEGPASGGRGTVAINAEARVTMWGVTSALVARAAGSFAKGDPLFSDQSAFATALTILPATASEFHKMLAICLAVVTTPTAATLARVWFSGGMPYGGDEPAG